MKWAHDFLYWLEGLNWGELSGAGWIVLIILAPIAIAFLWGFVKEFTITFFKWFIAPLSICILMLAVLFGFLEAAGLLN